VEDDLAVLRRWRDGDQRAGEELCGRYFDEIHRFFQHKFPNEADDLTQQTFLACVRSRDQFLGQSRFRTYLFAIARNELVTRLRRIPEFEHVDLEVSSLDELVSSPSSQLRKHEELEQIRTALRRLPVEQQVLLELHYWHDLDAAALAEMFSASPGAIRVRLLRARRALRDQLGAAAASGGVEDPLTSSLRDAELDGDL
jgi:RNA polymerase sigma-70 factor (ECF subfamily)